MQLKRCIFLLFLFLVEIMANKTENPFFFKRGPVRKPHKYISHIFNSEIIEKDTSERPVQNIMSVLKKISSGPCWCGIFVRQFFNSKNQKEPLLKRNYINVECNVKGEEHCRRICTDLRLLSQDRVRRIACSILGNASELMLSISTKICNGVDWLYSGLTTSELLCCKNEEKVEC